MLKTALLTVAPEVGPRRLRQTKKGVLAKNITPRQGSTRERRGRP